MTTTVRMSRTGKSRMDAWKVLAVPANCPVTPCDSTSSATPSTMRVASPSDTSGASSNDTEMDGSWLKWLIDSGPTPALMRSEEHTSELQSRFDLVCRLLL